MAENYRRQAIQAQRIGAEKLSHLLWQLQSKDIPFQMVDDSIVITVDLEHYHAMTTCQCGDIMDHDPMEAGHTPVSMWSVAQGKQGNWETPCPNREDKQHCNCWYDGRGCCACGANSLSANQKQFVEDAEAQELDVDFGYSGRGMYGKTCPAVRVNSTSEFVTAATYKTDQMGKGLVMYAER